MSLLRMKFMHMRSAAGEEHARASAYTCKACLSLSLSLPFCPSALLRVLSFPLTESKERKSGEGKERERRLKNTRPEFTCPYHELYILFHFRVVFYSFLAPRNTPGNLIPRATVYLTECGRFSVFHGGCGCHK